MYGRNRYADAGAAVGGALSIAPTHPVYGTGDAFKFSGGYWQNMQATDGFSDKDWTYTTDKNTPQTHWLHWNNVIKSKQQRLCRQCRSRL